MCQEDDCLNFEPTDKELWEPVVARLFQHVQSDTLERYKVREAWSFDWPTHGEAAVINRPLLQDRADCVCK